MKNYVDKDKLQEFATKLHTKQKTIFAAKSAETDIDNLETEIASLQAAVGSPLVASLIADMTDTTKIYVYVGSETGYTSGNWYYYDGTDWQSGGVYNSTAFVTDTTLATAGMAADAKATGDTITSVESVSKNGIEAYGENGTIYLYDFVQGNLDSNGNITASNYYIATENLHEFDFPIIFTPEEGYRYNVFRYIDGAYSQTTLLTGKEFPIPANMPFKLVIAKVASATLTPTDGYNKVALTGYAGWYGWHNASNIDKLTAGKELLPFVFQLGSDVAGTYAEYVNYRVTNKDFLEFDTDTTIYIDSGYKIGLHRFNDDGTFGADLGWKTGNFVALANTKYRFIIAKDPEDTSIVANLEEFYTKVSMETNLLKYINAQVGYSPLTMGIMQNGRAKLVAHMGYHVESPENTVPAFEAAGKLGYWGIESDLQQTSDGYYVMCHDTTVDRTTDGSGDISGMTLAQIRALHITGDSSLQIPTFEEYLSICKRYGCVPVIEIKSSVTNTKSSFEDVINVVKEFALDDKCIFIGSKWNLSNFKAASEDIPFMPVYQNGLSYDFNTEYAFVSSYKNVGIDWDNLIGLDFDNAKVLHANGMLYGTFTVDTVAGVKDAFLNGVDFVTTNTVLPTD